MFLNTVVRGCRLLKDWRLLRGINFSNQLYIQSGWSAWLHRPPFWALIVHMWMKIVPPSSWHDGHTIQNLTGPIPVFIGQPIRISYEHKNKTIIKQLAC